MFSLEKVSSWGNLQQLNQKIIEINHESDFDKILKNQPQLGLAYGNGRSYGDSCLNPDGILWKMRNFNRFISFDPENGLIKCQSGILLKEINQLCMGYGWFLPVLPGTQLITLGGAIANDVHGKNHHRKGSFGKHIISITLLRTSGEVIKLKRTDSLFAATVGGLGLTGIIIDVEIQLEKLSNTWLKSEILPFYSVQEFINFSEQSTEDWEFTAAWFDCLSVKQRGLFMRANFITGYTTPKPKSSSFRIPFKTPLFLLNLYSLKVFNSLYFYLKKNKKNKIIYFEDFLFPLDVITNWNTLYGPKGFYQYQCLIPKQLSEEGISNLITTISKSKAGSCLTVLKTFGNEQPQGLLSFATDGVTLAIDFPNRGTKTLQMLSELDKIVMQYNGKIYPAKDARMSQEIFEFSYPRYKEFLEFRDPGISSAFSRRIMGY